MPSTSNRVFYYHGGAVSIGGHLHHADRHIPTPASAALSGGGGSVTHEYGEFNFEDKVKARHSHTHITGGHQHHTGPWKQRVVSIVEGLDVLGRVTVERLVNQIVTEQPPFGGGPRKISFAGSQITGLKIDGQPVDYQFNPTLLPVGERTTDAHQKDAAIEPTLEWPELAKTALAQNQALMQTPNLPDWVKERFSWIGGGGTAAEALTLCSLVDGIDGQAVGSSFGHLIAIPNLGRIFLGEALVFPYAVHLSMLRVELEGAVSGVVTGGGSSSNGQMIPPN
jgi:hypothetical protein